ncbi:MAG: hypothetical protein K5777_00345 [Nitrosopumilus sp.]|nr:hypothetical protein [Nitrosopumilus sp.]
MATLTNKQHEKQQDSRIKKLENYLNQDKKEMTKLKNKIKTLEAKVKKLEKKK